MRQPNEIDACLAASAPSGILYRQDTDDKGVTTAWCTLASHGDLLPVASWLKTVGARLSTITVFQPKAPPAPKVAEGETAPPPPTFFGGVPMSGHAYEVDYHFDLDGLTLTVVAHVPEGGAIASLTGLFRAADWPEREMMEIYALQVHGHPDPRRLFIDEGIEGAVLERLIPMSTLTNSATTKGLWEKILAQTETPSS
ncbi:MAG: NADH-quinone oxidoreductase subunit C [Paludibacterium sp.]|uniref:NADH-quinone oxidoreductase subunit C n=1 Tax=Paludibacterium sp. TaxID=1917523 RepID=UPI0025F83874|nr:NADH-quinone oxidoreductase subunit C [Paludibacterium sp.]MBV8045695.1 NADH-quinone oxidoreductase subunit C [Paludibacterium sp.]MBV8646104.1 NADH-quinone oxidoreductase subunit C [Paludibacterium sp.]